MKKLRTKETFDAVVIVRIAKAAKDKMKQIAKSKGLNISTLARMWLMESLRSSKVY